MANKKSSFNYYSIDTNRYQDIKIKRLKKDFGCNGIAVYDYLLCEIYRDKGCFLEWDDSTAFDVAEYFGLKESQVVEIVNYCGHVGLFNKELLSRENVLTSLSIQRRFTDWSIKAKRTAIEIPSRIKIDENEEILPEESRNVPEKTHDYSVSLTQSKVKESKVKESKYMMPAGILPEEFENSSNTSPVKIKGEKEKGSGQKEKALYSKFMDEYNQFYKDRTGFPAKIDGQQGKAANAIITYLQKISNEKADEGVLKSWKWILEKWDRLDTYLRNRMLLSQISSELMNIINQIKNGTGKNDQGNTGKKHLGTSTITSEGKHPGKL